MIFFINSQMPENKSGIEHAQLKRMHLFQKQKVDAKIILRDWSPETHRLIRKAGLQDDQVINLFDYYQHAQVVVSQKVIPENIDFGIENTRIDFEKKQQRYLVWSATNQLVARINIDKEGLISSTELFDGFGNLYRVDHYDVRGFVSLSQWYTPDNQIGTEVWLTPDGQPVIEAFKHLNPQGELVLSGLKLTSHDNQVYQFDTIESLTRHFLDDLNQEFWSKEYPNIFILDRDHVADWAMLQLKKPAYRVIHLHNSHASDAQNPTDSDLNQFYEYALNNMDHYDAFITATKRQAEDVKKRLNPQIPIFTIPVGVVPDDLLNSTPVPVRKRQFGKIVAFARIAWEKHLDDLVRAVSIVHKSIPEVTLDLYGYADPSDDFAARRAIEDVIQAEELQKVVQLKGYTNQVDQVENEAMMFGLTSRMEGFNLAIMEGIAHGLIAFSYDVNYGPNEIVQNNVNGCVVPYGDYEALAQSIITVLKDPKLAQRYSTGAYKSAVRYSEDEVWKAWQLLLTDAKNHWPEMVAALPGNRGGN